MDIRLCTSIDTNRPIVEEAIAVEGILLCSSSHSKSYCENSK